MKLEDAIKSNKFKNEVHKAALNILYTSWWLKTIMSKELKEYGLTHEQYNVLRILKGKHPEHICIREITCRMIEKSSNVPRIIDRLETKKLVKRTSSDADRRETVIVLTLAGINILKHSTERIDKLMEKVILLDEIKAKDLNSILEEIRKNEQ
ncbi:MarR family winged helix-turn-helix transcriptional regulator [Parafilimonas sp.]|uniref:MarR family winged helix-turn-helix transcriptional regulator n=1 Tax=Parafilimonas sp. TaxID=1969739 RepID=UPI0039E48CCF